MQREWYWGDVLPLTWQHISVGSCGPELSFSAYRNLAVILSSFPLPSVRLCISAINFSKVPGSGAARENGSSQIPRCRARSLLLAANRVTEELGWELQGWAAAVFPGGSYRQHMDQSQAVNGPGLPSLKKKKKEKREKQTNKHKPNCVCCSGEYFFTSGITDLCRSGSSSSWWALPLTSQLVATQTTQRPCEHRVCDHLNHHTGWAADLCFFWRGPSAPPSPKEHPTAGQKCRADLHPVDTFQHGLHGAKPCTVQHPRTGTELDGSALKLEDFSFNKFVLNMVPFFATSWSSDFEWTHRTEHQFAWKSLQMWGSALCVGSLTLYSGNFLQM